VLIHGRQVSSCRTNVTLVAASRYHCGARMRAAMHGLASERASACKALCSLSHPCLGVWKDVAVSVVLRVAPSGVKSIWPCHLQFNTTRKQEHVHVPQAMSVGHYIKLTLQQASRRHNTQAEEVLWQATHVRCLDTTVIAPPISRDNVCTHRFARCVWDAHPHMERRVLATRVRSVRGMCAEGERACNQSKH
jgi:hypothetical protein